MDLYRGMDQLRDLTKLYMEMKNPRKEDESDSEEKKEEEMSPAAKEKHEKAEEKEESKEEKKEKDKKKEVEEGIDFKGAAREQARRDAIQAAKDKKSPSSKDRRLAMGKFRPGASSAERAEGGRDAMKEKGIVPKKGGQPMFNNFEIMADYLISEGQVQSIQEASEFLAGAPQEFLKDVLRFAEQRMLFMAYLVETGHCADLTEAASVYDESDPELIRDVIDSIIAE